MYTQKPDREGEEQSKPCCIHTAKSTGCSKPCTQNQEVLRHIGEKCKQFLKKAE